MAGRSSPEASAQRAGSWFSPDRILWGYSDELWPAYEIFGQPQTVLISGDDVIVGGWYGRLDEAELRAQLDALVANG